MESWYVVLITGLFLFTNHDCIAVENQAFDRIHRLGQVRPIVITRLIIENSIESRIIELQAKKKALFESTIGNDTSSLSRLSEEDFRFLFVL